MIQIAQQTLVKSRKLSNQSYFLLLFFSFNCGTGAAIITSNQTITLNEWHSVLIGRDGRHGYMSVDNQGVHRGMSKVGVEDTF